jgi:hypothetical protein
MIKLEHNDLVWVAPFIEGTALPLTKRKIKGFRHGLSLVEYSDGFRHHFCKYSFYLAGHYENGFLIVVKHKAQIPFAFLVEKIRLALPPKIARFLKLESK